MFDQSVHGFIFSHARMSWLGLPNTWTERKTDLARVWNLQHSSHCEGNIDSMQDNLYAVPFLWSDMGLEKMIYGPRPAQWLASIQQYDLVFCFVSSVFPCSLFVLQHYPLIQGVQNTRLGLSSAEVYVGNDLVVGHPCLLSPHTVHRLITNFALSQQWL